MKLNRILPSIHSFQGTHSLNRNSQRNARSQLPLNPSTLVLNLVPAVRRTSVDEESAGSVPRAEIARDDLVFLGREVILQPLTDLQHFVYSRGVFHKQLTLNEWETVLNQLSPETMRGIYWLPAGNPFRPLDQ